MKARVKMRLIDANKLFQEIEESMHNSPHSDPTYAAMHRHEHRYFLCEIDKQPEIDPIHAVNACYCRECFYSEPSEYEDNEGWITPIDEYWCNKHKDTMPLNGFCSEGRKDDTKNETI